MFVNRKKRDCTTCVAKTKALISFAVTAQLLCGFIFAYAKSRFSHDAAQIAFLKTANYNVHRIRCEAVLVLELLRN